MSKYNASANQTYNDVRRSDVSMTLLRDSTEVWRSLMSERVEPEGVKRDWRSLQFCDSCLSANFRRGLSLISNKEITSQSLYRGWCVLLLLRLKKMWKGVRGITQKQQSLALPKQTKRSVRFTQNRQLMNRLMHSAHKNGKSQHKSSDPIWLNWHLRNFWALRWTSF